MIRKLLGVMALLSLWAIVHAAELPAPSEYQIKAAFLYNFAKFVEWPSRALPESSASITLCVLGEDPFGADLDRTIEGKTINGRAPVTRRLKTLQGVDVCQILFISASERRRMGQILEALKDKSLLTIGETEPFARLGGVINFTMEQDKVRFEINVDAAERKGLKISSKLLKLAKVIRDRDAH
ncbi:MAG: YfiR family protein [Candidatus Entotheonellia bacterium]